MGAWGIGIQQDDTVLDVIDSFEQCLKEGDAINDASSKVRKQFRNYLSDRDPAARVWIGLAEAQWRYGGVGPDVLEHVTSYVQSGHDYRWWAPPDRARRKAVLRRFLEKIRLPNPKPRPRPKAVIRKPKFARGDCLSIDLPDNAFGATLVLQADHSDPEFGQNLIGVLEYYAAIPPTVEVFTRREWRRSKQGRPEIAWYGYWGFRALAQNFHVIGQTEILPSDPEDSSTSSNWSSLAMD